MRSIRKILIPLGALALIGLLRAGNIDMEIHCSPKQMDAIGKASVRGHVNKSKERWAYDVTIENKTFKDLAGVEVKYIIFFNREKLGDKAAAKLQRLAGNASFELLKPREKKILTTSAVELNKSQLASEWEFDNGARRKAEDTLVGLWVRIYQNGQQFAEYANPSALIREKWE